MSFFNQHISAFSEKAKEYANESFTKIIRKMGGERVTDIHAAARLSICDGCDKKGITNPLPLVELEGCTDCGCPFVGKAFFKNHLLEGVIMENGAPKMHEIRCTNSSGDKWLEVDAIFGLNRTQKQIKK